MLHLDLLQCTACQSAGHTGRESGFRRFKITDDFCTDSQVGANVMCDECSDILFVVESPCYLIIQCSVPEANLPSLDGALRSVVRRLSSDDDIATLDSDAGGGCDVELGGGGQGRGGLDRDMRGDVIEGSLGRVDVGEGTRDAKGHAGGDFLGGDGEAELAGGLGEGGDNLVVRGIVGCLEVSEKGAIFVDAFNDEVLQGWVVRLSEGIR